MTWYSTCPHILCIWSYYTCADIYRLCFVAGLYLGIYSYFWMIFVSKRIGWSFCDPNCVKKHWFAILWSRGTSCLLLRKCLLVVQHIGGLSLHSGCTQKCVHIHHGTCACVRACVRVCVCVCVCVCVICIVVSYNPHCEQFKTITMMFSWLTTFVARQC